MSELILVEDRVLIEPGSEDGQTTSGLYLPASVKEKERIQGGRVANVGPGYVIPNPDFLESENWDPSRSVVRYLPLQATIGDYAFFMRKEAIELEFENKKYLIIAHHNIVAIIRDQPDERDLYGTT